MEFLKIKENKDFFSSVVLSDFNIQYQAFFALLTQFTVSLET
jgi:hypothetical protein